MRRICEHCGGTCLDSGGSFKHAKRHDHYFCSRQCASLARRDLSEADILRAIELRIKGENWSKIEKLIGATRQQIQDRIWRVLFQNSPPSKERVLEIWYPRARRDPARAAWEWLEKRTGFILPK
jgi:hypothetical protein